MREEAYLSNLHWKRFDLNLGLRDDYFKINSILSDRTLEDYDASRWHNHFVSAFLRGRADTFDNGYFPTEGFTVGVDYAWTLTGLRSDLISFHSAKFDAKAVVPLGDALALLPSVNARALIAADDVPLPFLNTIGGSMAGRYLDQQLPFIGINNAIAVSNVVGIARADLRLCLARNNYLTAIANLGIEALSIRDVFYNEPLSTLTGFGLEYAYNSILGPVRFNVHWSDRIHRLGAYFSVGFDF